MKKRNRRILSLTVAILMLLVTVLSSSAAGITLTPIVQTPAALTSILSAHPELSVASSQPLYSPTNEITAYYYTFSPTGYAIASVQGEVVEWSPTATREIPANQTVYYAGPLSYFTKSGASYVDVYSGGLYAQTDISVMHDYYAVTAEAYEVSEIQQATRGVVPPSIIENHYTTYTPDASVHQYCPTCPSNLTICGPVAAAILLDYYNDFIIPALLPTMHSDDLTHELINYIQPEIFDSPGTTSGSNMLDISGGINALISDYHPSGIDNYSASIRYIGLSFDVYRNFIVSSNTPVIVGLDQHPTYGQHWVVGYGTYETYTELTATSQYCIVVDGWGNSNVYISHAYVDYSVYLSN